MRGPQARLRILVTAGPTVERIDAVRFLSNRSSGRMGYAVAREAARRGHAATLVSGPTALPAPPGVRRIEVESARQMLRVCRARFGRSDALVMAAAVSDYRARRAYGGKRRKVGLRASLELVRNPDLLAHLCARKGDRLVVGFALGSRPSLRQAFLKLCAKGCDAVVANAIPFMGPTAAFQGTLLALSGEAVFLGPTKAAAARRLVRWIEARLAKGATARGWKRRKKRR